jgi:hypothetical protein
MTNNFSHQISGVLTMSDFRFFRFNFYSLLSFTIFALALLTIPLTTSCSALVTPMNDDDALKTLR